jgi:signal transduction histidine kinase
MDEASDSLLLNKLAFNHTRNFLKFYLSSNCFSNNDQVSYMYQLTGIDDDWRTSEANPFISYTNLPPGNFEFKYMAINSDGVRSELRSLQVIITPPFYKTIYFYLLVAMVVVLCAYAFYRYRIRHILKLQEVRNKIARDLHDDIGSTIGSINLYSQVAHLKLGEVENEDVKSILDKIETASREVIDKTGDAVWAANPANDSLKHLVFRVESYAASVLGTAGIRIRINCDEKLSETFLEMDERKNIFLIYKEAIHNIIKYAEASEVNIFIGRKGGRFQMIIADDGRGFAANGKAYNGNGIKNMKARVESMKGTFSIRSEENKGTAVEIII